MPRIRRRQLPQSLLVYLLTRMRQRNIAAEQLIPLARWLDSESDVPEGTWFRRFPDFTVCGEGEFIKTFLLPGQMAEGRETA